MIMETKICTNPKCKKDKPISEFYISNGVVSSWCKGCSSLSDKRYRKSKRGVATVIYNSQKNSSGQRGYGYPIYSRDEFIKWCLEQPIFHTLYDAWVKGGYNRWLKPSIDRIDDYIGYTFDNIRIVTWRENCESVYADKRNGVNNKQSKAVLMIDKISGDIINEYYSMHQAERDVGISCSNIHKCCNGEIYQSGGFIWEYK